MIDKKVYSEEFMAEVREIAKGVGATDHALVVVDENTGETHVALEASGAIPGLMIVAGLLKAVANNMGVEPEEISDGICKAASEGREISYRDLGGSGPKLVD